MEIVTCFRKYGGYMLKLDGKVVAAAVVEIQHERYFKEGSKDNHVCAIIYIHEIHEHKVPQIFCRNGMSSIDTNVHY